MDWKGEWEGRSEAPFEVESTRIHSHTWGMAQVEVGEQEGRRRRSLMVEVDWVVGE